MSLTVLKIMLVLGIIGHTLNMYCDRILSIFPNGKLTLADLKTFGKDDKLAKIQKSSDALCHGFHAGVDSPDLRQTFRGCF